jgi:rod shape determining protein RodA
LLLTINQAFFVQQFVFLIVGIMLLIGASLLHPAILWWLSPLGYIGSLFFLLWSYVGPAVRGSQRWIVIAGQQLQPSEFVKPLLLLFFSWAITRFPPRKLQYVPLHIMLFFIPFFLVLQQPDLGTSLVYASFWLAMMLAGGLSLPLVVISGVIGTLSLPGIWNLLAPYQRDRITTFLNPALDPAGAGYNALQAMIAVGSGQFFGRGLGRGTQSHLRFLPEHHTDFIFATLVEELGFVGGALLIVGYAYLLWRIIRPLVQGTLTQAYPYIFTIGLFAMILTQIFINTGMNMGIIPITGITLPFVSYGGSSVLSLCLSFGLLWAIRGKDGVRP